MASDLEANILLVNDRREQLTAVGALLERLNQNVVTASSGEEALRHLLELDFAVILLDIHMPGMDGFETASLIRQRKSSEHTPIIFLTAYGQTDANVARGYSLGAVDYIQTPVVPEILRAKVSVFVELHKKNQQVKRQAADLERSLKELTEVNNELEAFCYSISHDLRAPLRSMTAFAQILAEEYGPQLDQHGKDYTKRIGDSAQQMDALLHDLLEYGCLSQAKLSKQPVNLDSALEEVEASISKEIQDRNARIEVRRPLGCISAHPSAVKQILENLVANALKFVQPDQSPHVRIHTEQRDKTVRLWVEDNGIGIAPEHQERIFGLFQRLHPASHYPGTGIGLAIVRRGVERFGGKVGVESIPNRGSRFWVEFARAPLRSGEATA